MTASLQPDIILLATNMPDVDSTALCRLLKRQLTRPAQIYALTGRHDADLERRCLDAGFSALLTTPISASQLSTLDESVATG
jgi:CheY-like chemotaxis protein